MSPSERTPRNPRLEGRSRNIALVGSTISTLACVVYLWRSWRIFAVIFLVLLPIEWILNLTVFSPNRPLPRDKVAKHPLGLDSRISSG